MNELDTAAQLAQQYLSTLNSRPVAAAADSATLRRTLGGPLPDDGIDGVRVISELARAADPGLVASAGPRYFGFVIGGSLPAALAADWLTSAWDQNAGMFVASPAAAVVEDVVAEWLLDLFGLPRTASVGFVTGCQMANFSGLAAGRHAVLERAGWDVEERGLIGAPSVNVVLGAQAHVTVYAALRMLGLGTGTPRRVAADDQGRMRPAALREVLQSCEGPMIVCAQAGEVNTGAFDPFSEIAALCREHGAWLHVDGAFGLWAAASPERRALVRGAELAHSWATDAHKWLNVPYDAGIAIVNYPEAHNAALTKRAAYLVRAADGDRDPADYTPEASRRARGFTIYAALRALGRRGVAALVDRCCTLAQHMADCLRAAPAVEVLNDVQLNQVLVRFRPPRNIDADSHVRAITQRVQRDGICWLSGTTWQGRAAIRISISGWSTTAADIERSAAAILQAAEG